MSKVKSSSSVKDRDLIPEYISSKRIVDAWGLLKIANQGKIVKSKFIVPKLGSKSLGKFEVEYV